MQNSLSSMFRRFTSALPLTLALIFCSHAAAPRHAAAQTVMAKKGKTVKKSVKPAIHKKKKAKRAPQPVGGYGSDDDDAMFA